MRGLHGRRASALAAGGHMVKELPITFVGLNEQFSVKRRMEIRIFSISIITAPAAQAVFNYACISELLATDYRTQVFTLATAEATASIKRQFQTRTPCSVPTMIQAQLPSLARASKALKHALPPIARVALLQRVAAANAAVVV